MPSSDCQIEFSDVDAAQDRCTEDGFKVVTIVLDGILCKGGFHRAVQINAVVPVVGDEIVTACSTPAFIFHPIPIANDLVVENMDF
jgi:hypothetical protein